MGPPRRQLYVYYYVARNAIREPDNCRSTWLTCDITISRFVVCGHARCTLVAKRMHVYLPGFNYFSWPAAHIVVSIVWPDIHKKGPMFRLSWQRKRPALSCLLRIENHYRPHASTLTSRWERACQCRLAHTGVMATLVQHLYTLQSRNCSRKHRHIEKAEGMHILSDCRTNFPPRQFPLG